MHVTDRVCVCVFECVCVYMCVCVHMLRDGGRMSSRCSEHISFFLDLSVARCPPALGLRLDGYGVHFSDDCAGLLAATTHMNSAPEAEFGVVRPR